MRIDGLIWHQAVEDKLWSKHGVTRAEVHEVFANAPRFRFVEGGDYAGEDVYAAFGRSDAGPYLTIFFVYKRNRKAMLLSARAMSARERKAYSLWKEVRLDGPPGSTTLKRSRSSGTITM